MALLAFTASAALVGVGGGVLSLWLLLLCGVACVQFCFSAFQSYAQLTAIDMLLGVQARVARAEGRAPARDSPAPPSS